MDVGAVAIAVGGEVRGESVGGIVERELEDGIVYLGGFVEVDIDALGGAQHEGRLESEPRGKSFGGEGFAADTIDERAHLREGGGGGGIFVGVVVAWQPEGFGVGMESVLGVFVLYDELAQVGLCGIFVTERPRIVEEAEAKV